MRMRIRKADIAAESKTYRRGIFLSCMICTFRSAKTKGNPFLSHSFCTFAKEKTHAGMDKLQQHFNVSLQETRSSFHRYMYICIAA